MRGVFLCEIFGGKKLIFLLLIFGAVCASWLLPHHFLPWPSVYQDFLVFFAALIVVLKWAFVKAERIYFSKEVLVLGLLVIIPWAQFLAGQIYYLGDAVIVSLYLSLFVVAVMFGGEGCGNIKSRERIAVWLSSIFLIGGLVSLFIALRQWLQISNSIWETDFVGGRPFANLGQSNNFSTLLCVAVASLLYLYEKKYISRFLLSFLSLLLLFGIALSQSRTPWVSLPLVATFIFLRRPCSSIPMRGIVFWCFFYLLSVSILPLLSAALYLDSGSFSGRNSVAARVDIWLQLFEAVKVGGFWGYGWGQVSVAQASVATDHPAFVMTEHAHNILLDLLLWSGPLLGVLILVFFAIWGVRILRRSACLESKFSVSAILFILVHSCVEYPLEYAYFLFPFGVLLGLASSCAGLGAMINVRAWLSGSLLVMFGCLFFVIWSDYRIVEENYNLMRFEKANVRTVPASASTSSVILLTQLRALVDVARFTPREGVSGEELAWLKTVSLRYPYFNNLLKYSYSLALNGNSAQACKDLLILRGLNSESKYVSALSIFIVGGEREPRLHDVVNDLKLSCQNESIE